MSKVTAVTSLCLSALAWLGVLLLYASTSTGFKIVLVVLLAGGAMLWAVFAVATGRRSPLAWVALAVSLIFPIAVWEWLGTLGGDAF